MFQLPSPLHPLFVHLPLALALLVPFIAVAVLVLGRRHAAPARAWRLAVGTLALLTLSAWAALQTGEGEEEKVEDVVSETALHEHEERAELFLIASGFTFAVAMLGLLPGRIGTSARVASVVGTVVVLVGALRVGHSGGNLAYAQGAAAAYVVTGASSGTPSPVAERRRDDDRER